MLLLQLWWVWNVTTVKFVKAAVVSVWVRLFLHNRSRCQLNINTDAGTASSPHTTVTFNACVVTTAVQCLLNAVSYFGFINIRCDCRCCLGELEFPPTCKWLCCCQTKVLLSAEVVLVGATNQPQDFERSQRAINHQVQTTTTANIDWTAWFKLAWLTLSCHLRFNIFQPFSSESAASSHDQSQFLCSLDISMDTEWQASIFSPLEFTVWWNEDSLLCCIPNTVHVIQGYSTL